MNRSLRLALASIALALLAGCGLPGAPMPPSLELPKPVSDLRAERQGSKVTLTWTSPRETTDRAGIRRMGATRVCRAIVPISAMDNAPKVCEKFVSAVNVAPSKRDESHPAPASFTDTLPADLPSQHPLEAAVYTVEVLNDHGRTAGASNPAPVPLAPTLPPPANVRAEVTAGGPEISWQKVVLPESGVLDGELAYRIRVFRRDKDKPNLQPAPISETPEPAGRGPTDPTRDYARDSAAEWEKHYVYSVAVVTSATSQGKVVEVLGDPSPAVEVFTHDVFPPVVPSGLQAVFTEAGTERYVDLTWLPSSGADIAGYNVYRWEEGGQPRKINSDLRKTPTSRDANVAPGHRYYYAVTAVDIRGNESERSQPANELVPK